jgi:hypothetical protein
MIYQSDGSSGFYFYTGSGWVQLAVTTNVWSVNGNAGTNPFTNFIGTTDNQPLVFKSNSEIVGRLQAGNDVNLSIGYWAGLQNAGINNIAIGNRSLLSNIAGFRNVAIGSTSLFANTSGSNNIAIGTGSLNMNTDGNSNVAIGDNALNVNSTGNSNSVLGRSALGQNTSGLAQWEHFLCTTIQRAALIQLWVQFPMFYLQV